MGCANSKQHKFTVAADVYRPPPTSISLFDVTKIEEPWLLNKAPSDDSANEKPLKHGPDPLSLLDKMDAFELAPKSWSEVSKVLEDLKPLIHQTQLMPQSTAKKSPPSESAGFRSVKDNSFVVRDRLEREGKKEAEELPRWKKRDPLEGYPETPPPGNTEGLVIYTTTLRGVRRTFEDCERMREVVEGYAVEEGIEVEERDVSLHGEYLKEVRELIGEGVAVPRLFVAGRYVGGIEEVVELAETGKYGEIMRCVGRRIGGKKGKGGRKECEGCGGARFVPCRDCNGSCKVVAEDGKGPVRCGMCNENGLALCPMCH